MAIHICPIWKITFFEREQLSYLACIVLKKKKKKEGILQWNDLGVSIVTH